MNQSEWEVTFRKVKRKKTPHWSPLNEKSENSGTTFLVTPQGDHFECLQIGPLHSSLSVVNLSPKGELIRLHKKGGALSSGVDLHLKRVRIILHVGKWKCKHSEKNWCCDSFCAAGCFYTLKMLDQCVENGFWNISSEVILNENMEA